MAILPLPQFEADLEADRKAYEALKTPKTLVVRFGVLKLVGEFANDSGAKPGCGSKLVIRTHRGTEIGEMLTSTCPNSGCSKSVSRQDMLKYIENSGGRDYPFFTDGRVLRVATAEDLARQSALEQSRHGIRTECKRIVEELEIPIKVVDAEPILGDERLYIYYYSEDRVDLRDLPARLSRLFHNRIELRQVGARDEARVTADYERCGQYCCCKNFLKVLKPVSMKSAKIQKATLDPLKISGRCGRLMCCLRYEDETYESLRKKLPKKKSRVGTPEGDGFVVDSQILTQLVLVQLDIPEPDGKIRQVAIPVENLAEPVSKTPPPPPAMPMQGPDRRGPGRPGPGPARGLGSDHGARSSPPSQDRPPREGREQHGEGPREPGRDPSRRSSREEGRPDRRGREDRPRGSGPNQGSGQNSSGQNSDSGPGSGNASGGRAGPRPPRPGRPPQDRPQGDRGNVQRGDRPSGPRQDRGPGGSSEAAPPRTDSRQGGPRPDRGPRDSSQRGPLRPADDDFSPQEIDDLLSGPDDGDDGSPDADPKGGGEPEGPDGPRRKRRRRRRRGRGGPGGGAGPAAGPGEGGGSGGGPPSTP